ncbi:MAG: DUF1640 domain-containing protein [Alphaproteobacteria bacterium]
MATITFDTHIFIKRLITAGMPEPQAEAVTAMVKEAQDVAAGELATRADIARLEAATKADIRDVRGEMALGFARVQAEVNLLKWMVGILLAGVASLVLRAFFPL